MAECHLVPHGQGANNQGHQVREEEGEHRPQHRPSGQISQRGSAYCFNLLFEESIAQGCDGVTASLLHYDASVEGPMPHYTAPPIPTGWTGEISPPYQGQDQMLRPKKYRHKVDEETKKQKTIKKLCLVPNTLHVNEVLYDA